MTAVAEQQATPLEVDIADGEDGDDVNPSPDAEEPDLSLQKEPDLTKAPEYAERTASRRAVEAIGGLRVDTLRSSGAAALGDGAVAVHVAIGGTPQEAKFSVIPAHRFEPPLHVPARVDTALDDALHRRHLIRLGGPDHTGRTWAALASLSRRYGTDAVHELHPGPGTRMADIGSLATVLQKDSGYLLRMPAGSVEPFYLRQLDAIGRSIGAAVILIGERADDDDIDPFLVVHRPPDPVEVFARHLRRHLMDEGRCVGECADCRGACVDEYVRLCLSHTALIAELSTLDEPRRAVGHAETLAKGRPSMAELGHVIGITGRAALRVQAVELLRAGRVRAGDEVDAERHTRDPADTYRRCFRLAYGLLFGLPIDAVANAAEQLYTIMEPVPAGVEDRLAIRRSWDGFGLTFGDLVPPTMRGGPDDDERVPGAQGRTATLCADLLVNALLDVAWNDLPGSHDRLLTWLDELVNGQSIAVRQRVAIVAALFAEYDFDAVRIKLFQDWAGSLAEQRRQAAALAMAQIAANSARLRPEVAGRVHEWIIGSLAFQDTAVRAYASGLAQVLPGGHVLSDIRIAARNPRQLRNSTIALAVAELASVRTIDAVVAALTDWQASADPPLVFHASRAVTEVAKLDSDGAGRPLMLAWANQTRGHDTAGGLVRHAMADPTMVEDMTQAVMAWIAATEGDPVHADALVGVLRSAWIDDRLRARARFYLAALWEMPASDLVRRVIRLIEV